MYVDRHQLDRIFIEATGEPVQLQDLHALATTFGLMTRAQLDELSPTHPLQEEEKRNLRNYDKLTPVDQSRFQSLFDFHTTTGF